jgi:hypothetical protein
MRTPPADQAIRIWTRPLRGLRLIAARTGERLAPGLDRLVAKERQRAPEQERRADG